MQACARGSMFPQRLAASGTLLVVKKICSRRSNPTSKLKAEVFEMGLWSQCTTPTSGLYRDDIYFSGFFKMYRFSTPLSDVPLSFASGILLFVSYS